MLGRRRRVGDAPPPLPVVVGQLFAVGCVVYLFDD